MILLATGTCIYFVLDLLRSLNKNWDILLEKNSPNSKFMEYHRDFLEMLRPVRKKQYSVFYSNARNIPLSDSVSLVFPTRCLLLRALNDRVSFRVITALFEPSPSLSDIGPDSTADDGAFDCGGVSTRDLTPGGAADFLIAAVFLRVCFVVADESADESESELLSARQISNRSV